VRELIHELMLMQRNISQLSEQAERLERMLGAVARPSGKLRPAAADDIVADAILWRPNGADSWSFAIVGEVVRPSDQFNGFVGQDGNNYGLNGLFVEHDSA
jgi:hypothetical protein